jgi:hypothetical protein
MSILLIGILLAFISIMIIVCLKFHTQVKGVLSWIYKHLKGVKIQAFTIPIAVIFMVILFILAPDKIYFFIFLGVFVVGLYLLISHLLDYIYVISLDWSTDQIQVIALSNRAFNNYKILDEMGKPDFLKYWLKCSSGKIALVDKIDTKEKVIVLNPCFSNFDFTKNYKNVDLEMKKKINELFNTLAEFEGRFEYETVKKARVIFLRSSLLSALADNDKKEVKQEVKQEVKAVETKQPEVKTE